MLNKFQYTDSSRRYNSMFWGPMLIGIRKTAITVKGVTYKPIHKGDVRPQQLRYITTINYINNFSQHFFLLQWTRYVDEKSAWSLTLMINYWSHILHSSHICKKWNTMGQHISYLQTSMKVYDSVHWEVLYNILIQFVIPKKLVWLIQMCWNKAYRKVQIDMH